MFNGLLVNKSVLIYLREQGNKAEGYCTDQCGRFILPLHWVTFGQHTDEGPQVLLNGIVREITGDQLLIQPFGFHLPLQTRGAELCVKHPKGLLLIQLLSYFADTNRTILYNQRLHLNGEEICFAI
jgi:hypothetical protein